MKTRSVILRVFVGLSLIITVAFLLFVGCLATLPSFQNAAGNCYYYGTRNIPQNYSKTVWWYKKAADKGCLEAQAQLGSCYYYGQGLPEDYPRAVAWYVKAANQGLPEAQLRLGWCYLRGRGVAQDSSAAVKWFQKSAEQDNAFAQYI